MTQKETKPVQVPAILEWLGRYLDVAGIEIEEIVQSKTISQETAARMRLRRDVIKPLIAKLRVFDKELAEQIKANNRIKPLAKTHKKQLQKEDQILQEFLQ